MTSEAEERKRLVGQNLATKPPPLRPPLQQIKKKTKSQMKATQNYMYRKSNTVPESLLDFVAEIHEQDR